MHEEKIAHLSFIQTIINRMAQNSFLIKGWTITIIVALLAFSAKSGNAGVAGVGVFPVILFWILDGYFLKNERLFRELYAHAIEDDFESNRFSLDPRQYASQQTAIFRVIFSRSLVAFYLTVILLVILTAIFVEAASIGARNQDFPPLKLYGINIQYQKYVRLSLVPEAKIYFTRSFF